RGGRTSGVSRAGRPAGGVRPPHGRGPCVVDTSLGCRGPLARTVVRITGGPVRRGLRTLAHCRGTSGVSAWWQGRGWFPDAPAPSRGPGPPHDRGGRSTGFGHARGR